MKLNKLAAVYVIHNPLLGITKIGFSDNPKIRLAGLICSSGVRLKLVYHTPLLANHKTIEEMAHNKFNYCRGVGEWFNLAPELAVDYLKNIEGSFRYDHVISDFERYRSYKHVADKHNITRQAVIKRLRRHSEMEWKDEQINQPPSTIEKIGEIVDIAKYRRIAPNQYKDKDGRVEIIKYINGNFCKVV